MALEVTLVGSAESKKRNTSSKDVLCCLRIPNQLLFTWYLEMSKARRALSYVNLCNASIRGRAIQLPVEENSRLEGSVCKKAGKLNCMYKALPSRKRKGLLDKSILLDVMRDEVVNVEKLNHQVEKLNLDVNYLREEIR